MKSKFFLCIAFILVLPSLAFANTDTLPSVYKLVLDDDRLACVVNCERTLLSTLFPNDASITDPNERADSIAEAYDSRTLCDTQCAGDTTVDQSTMCILDCVDTGVAALAQCEEIADKTDRGKCLEMASKDYISCENICTPPD